MPAPTRREAVAALAAIAAVPTAKPEIDVVRLGADPTGRANCTSAFQAAAKAIEARGGGVLTIPPGHYRVGRQSFAGARGKGFAFQGADVVSISHCPRPVVIRAAGARLQLEGGLRYGAFDPLSRAPFKPPPGAFYDRDFTATLGSFFHLEANADVSLEGPLSLDGAIQRQIIGGPWGDTGRQLTAIGVMAYNNRRLRLKGLRSANQGLDHLLIGWAGLTSADPPYPHHIEDVRGDVCGRNGLSWVGGNAFTCVDCQFERSGRTGVLESSPAAGVDIEAESSICRNGRFVRLRSVDNAGAGLDADAGDVADVTFTNCEFVGAANWAAWPNKPGLTFEHCRFVGPLVHVFGAKDPRRAVRFIDCVNTFDPRQSPTGRIFGAKSNFTGASGATWTGGSIDPGHIINPPGAGGGGGIAFRGAAAP